MNQLSRAALGAALACAFVPAHAAATYQAGFTLDEMPRLSTGDSGPGTIDGRWNDDRESSVYVSTREVVGLDTLPETGEVIPVFGNYLHNQIGETLPSGPLDFGNSTYYIYGPSELTRTSARAEIGSAHLSAQVEVRDVPAEGWSGAHWLRSFWLAAGASFTFSGLASLDITGDVPALDAAPTIAGGASFLSMVYQDAAGRAGVDLSATLRGDLPLPDDPFAYSFAPDGRMSITVTNRGTTDMLGNIRVAAYAQSDFANVSAAVPEPATWLMLFGGVALVAGTTRRRKQAAASPGGVVAA